MKNKELDVIQPGEQLDLFNTNTFETINDIVVYNHNNNKKMKRSVKTIIEIQDKFKELKDDKLDKFVKIIHNSILF